MSAPWLDRSSYPFGAHYLELPAGRMHYVDEGAGSPVVMVHGNPTWSFLYRHQIRHLRSRYRCVAPDHLGFGLSDKPTGWSYHPREHASNLANLIEGLGLGQITLVVHDWGGPIGLSYALDHPDHVARLIILNTWLWRVDGDPYYAAFSGLVGGPLGRYLTRRFNFFARVVMKSVYGDKSRLTPELHRHYLQPLDGPDAREGSAQFPRHILRASDWLGTLWSRRGVIKSIPKLFVWGMKDKAFRPKELARWESAFPQSTVVRLEDVGHYVPEEAPDRLNEAMDRFFSETASERST